MPGGDGTGPMGSGPMSGRGLGPCGRGLRRWRNVGPNSDSDTRGGWLRRWMRFGWTDDSEATLEREAQSLQARLEEIRNRIDSLRSQR